MEVSSPTHTSRETICLSIMLSSCFVSFSFRFCTFQQQMSTTGSCFKLLTSWNISGVFIGTLEKLFMMLCIFGSWPISAFTPLTQKHRTWGWGWKGEGSIARNDNSERYEMKFFFGQHSFSHGLVIGAGYLDAGGKVCHYTQKNMCIYIKATSFLFIGRKFPGTVKRDLFIP